MRIRALRLFGVEIDSFISCWPDLVNLISKAGFFLSDRRLEKTVDIKFKQILKDIYKGSAGDFSGIGLILYKDKTKIPIFPLSIENPNLQKEGLVEALIDISKLNRDNN